MIKKTLLSRSRRPKEGITSGYNRLSFYILILGCFMVQCTSYFNTFYNARIAFKEANLAHQKVLKNYPDSIIVVPTPEIVKKYDRTIEKSNKVIEVYDKNPRWHDDALLLMGKSFYYKGENDRAIRILNRLLQEQPESKHVPEAYLYLGRANIALENYDNAQQMLETIIQRYPDFSDIDQVSFLLVEISILRGGRSQAIELLEKTYKTAHSEDLRRKAFLKIIDLYIELKQYEKAVVLLEKTRWKRGATSQLFRLDKARFTCYLELGRSDQALALVEKMLRSRKYEVFRPDLLLMKASILRNMGRDEDAIAVYLKIVNGIDTTTISKDTSTVIGKALFELALLHQKKNEDYEKASYYANLAYKSGSKAVRIQAGHMVTAFEKLKKLRNEKDSTEIGTYNRLFRIGELFRFELAEPDSAYYQFLAIADTTADSLSIKPMALCAAAFISRDDMKDTAHADSLFKVVLRTFPMTEFARIAQKELNLVVTEKTRRDSAYEAFSRAELLLYGKNQDVKGAISGFYDVYRLFPDIDIAPKSLFVAAWLVDEKLEKNKTAKELYERLCEKYPNSYYCVSEARPRLEEASRAILGLTGQASKLSPDTLQNPTVQEQPKTGAEIVPSREDDDTDDEIDDEDEDEYDDED